MLDPSLNEEVVVRYLLGELSEVEANHLDELSVADDDFVEFLERVEFELVDDYVNGELSEHNRLRFESYYLALPERREKVTIARTLRKHREQIPRPVRTPPTSSHRWVAMAAALAVLVLGGYLIFANIQLKQEIAQMKRELGTMKEAQNKKKPDAESQAPNTVPVALFAMNLSPQRRDVASVPEFKIPANIELVQVTLKVENDDFPLYSTVLKDSASGKILWSSESEKSTDRSLVVKFPAEILKSGDYILELLGKTDGNKPVIIAGYPFYVVTQ